MQEGLWKKRKPGQPHGAAFGGAALRVRLLRETVHPATASQKAPAHAHRGIPLRVRLLLAKVPGQRAPPGAHPATSRRAALCLRTLSQEIRSEKRFKSAYRQPFK